MAVDPSTTEGAAEPVTPTPDEGTTPAPVEPSVSDANPTPADSSTADGTPPEGGEGDKKPDSLLGAVEAALKPEEPDADSPTADKGEDDPEGKSKSEKPEGDTDDDKPPFHEHPAWKRVIGERDEYKVKLAEYEPAQEAVTRLQNFLTEKNLTVDEFNTSLQISAAMRNDPHEALRLLTPYFTALQEITGDTLPADVQRALDDGLISETYAQEVARARAGQTIATQQAARSQEQVTQANEREAQAQVAQRQQALSGAATAWERERSAKDPDYAKKASLFRQDLENRWRRGEIPQDEAAMRKQCDEAMQAVETTLRSFIPKKGATTPNPQIGAAGNPATAAQPKSMLDVVNMAAGG